MPEKALYYTADGKSMMVRDAEYADIAKGIMSKRKQDFGELTTSKLRGIYGLITNIYSRINEPDDYEDKKSDIQYLKVRMAYEAGRDSKLEKDSDVKKFLNKTHLMDMLDGIETYDQFMLYCRYAESLVAYFKFYGGKDN